MHATLDSLHLPNSTSKDLLSSSPVPRYRFQQQLSNGLLLRTSLARVDLQLEDRGDELYERIWEREFMQQLTSDIGRGEGGTGVMKQRVSSKYRQIERRMSHHKRRQMQKFRAYAVKMKIPGVPSGGLGKKKVSEKLMDRNVPRNIKSSNHVRHGPEVLPSRFQLLLKQNHQEIVKYYEEQIDPKFQHLAKREIKSQKQARIHIRKRTIPPNDNSKTIREAELINKINKLSNPISPKDQPRVRVVLKRQQPDPVDKSIDYTATNTNSLGPTSTSKSRKQQYEVKTLQNSFVPQESPIKLQSKSPERARSPLPRNRKEGSPSNKQSTTKYLQKGINFKKKSNDKRQNTITIQEGIDMNKQQIVGLKPTRQSFSTMLNRQQLNPFTQKLCSELRSISPDKFLFAKDSFKQQIGSRLLKHEERARRSNPQGKLRCSNTLVFNSQDTYIKRLLLQRDWIINPDLRSKFYHLKWVYLPSGQDYNNLREGQMFNHIKNSHQLTSKNYLNKNLKNSVSFILNLQDFYPKCYDISKTQERQEFFQEFVQQFMMRLLRKLYKLVEEKLGSKVREMRLDYERRMGQDQYESRGKGMSPMRVKGFRKIQMEDYKHFKSDFMVHMNLVIVGLKYWRRIRKRREMEVDRQPHFLEYICKQFQQHIKYLEEYSKMSPECPASLAYFQKEYYATPSQLTIQRIVKQYVYFEKIFNHSWSIFGDKNIWIVKPCSAARGTGIYLEDSSHKILFQSKGIQSKIVQKYIQNPLILHLPAFPQIKGRKFDIRQWVLLKSLQPLQIYMFSHCYVRICADQYRCDLAVPLTHHLTNYSFNKTHFKDVTESVMDITSFKKALRQQYGVDYDQLIRPKIKQIVIKSIQACRQAMSDCNRRCFSLLGYDILLDHQFNPWLLEVNMSPACQQRTQWLKQYLKQMGAQMLALVLPPASLQPNNSTQLMTQHTQKNKSDDQIIADQPFAIKQIVEVERVYLDQEVLIHPIIGQENQLISAIKDSVPLSNQNIIEDNQSGQKEWQGGKFQDQIQSYDQREQNSNSQEQQIHYKNYLQYQTVDPLCAQGWQNMQIQKDEPEELEIEESVSISETSSDQDWDTRAMMTSSCPLQNNSKMLHQVRSQQLPPLQYNKRQLESETLHWQLICFQEYHNQKREPDLLLEVVGNRINLQKYQKQEKEIDFYQSTKSKVLDNVICIQANIRTFIYCLNLKNKKFTTVSILNRSTLRSACHLELRNLEFPSHMKKTDAYSISSIWHYSYLHRFQDEIYEKIKMEAPVTTRLNKRIFYSSKSKSLREPHKEKIEAVSQEIDEEMQQVVTRQVLKEEYSKAKEVARVLSQNCFQAPMET